MLRGQQARAPGWGRLWGLASVTAGLLGSAAQAQDWCPHSDPEPLHLLLPTALLADTSVEQGSIGTPLVSISSCFSIFDKAIVFDGRNRWVLEAGLLDQTPRLWCHFLNFLLHPIPMMDPRAGPAPAPLHHHQHHTYFMAEDTSSEKGRDMPKVPQRVGSSGFHHCSAPCDNAHCPLTSYLERDSGLAAALGNLRGLPHPVEMRSLRPREGLGPAKLSP